MPYADPETRKQYHREYMREYARAHPPTSEERRVKAQYARDWREAHPEYVAPNAAASQRRWREMNPDYAAERNRFYNYGMLAGEYDALVEEQEHRCAICGALDEKLVVDHCHDSGRVRGLLCDRCNVGIGCMGDNMERLMRAADYLAKGR